MAGTDGPATSSAGRDDARLSSDTIDAARSRIAAAYDPKLFREAGHRLADLLADQLQAAESSRGAVLPWCDPPKNTRYAFEIARAGAEHSTDRADPATCVDQFADLVATMLKRGHNLHDPRYIGHQVPAPVPIAGLFDAVGSVTNQPMAIYEMGPWATAVEEAMVAILGGRIGWRPGSFAGLVTHGGSLANLTGLLTARNVSLGDAWERGVARPGLPPALIVQADAHYSVARSAGVLGLGMNNVLRVALDDR